MKIKKDYILRVVADEYMVVPIGKETVVNPGVFQVNAVGAKLFELFQKGAEIVDAEKLLVDLYKIPRQQAKEDVRDFIRLLQDYAILEE